MKSLGLLLMALLVGMGNWTGMSTAFAHRFAFDIQQNLQSHREVSDEGNVQVSEPATHPQPIPISLSLLEKVGPSQPSAQSFPWRFAELFRSWGDTEPPAEDAQHSDPATGPAIEIVRDHKVERHLQYFHTTIRDRFEKWLGRFFRYQPMVQQVFAEFNIPTELAYLSLVESGFNPRAYSRARATGPWQFMKGTARLYGLRINYYVDERRDPIKSTVAAAQHLRDLYDIFGTWPLALAAYNAGQGRVQRALKRIAGESFNEIARTRYLRRETKEYVPRFMAATIITKNPDQYGFSSLLPDPHQFEEVVVTRPLHLRDVGRTAEIPYQDLRSLNPELRRNVTPPGRKAYLLKVPVGTKEKVEAILDDLPSWKKSRPPKTKGSKAPKGWYRVRLGDSLWTIARRFRLSVRELKDRNNISGRLIRPGDLLAIRP